MPEAFTPTAEEKLTPRELALSNAEVHVGLDTVGGFVGRLQIADVDIIVPRTSNNPRRSGIPRLGPVFGPVKGTDWEALYPDLPQHGNTRTIPMGLISHSFDRIELEHAEGPAEFMGVWQNRLILSLLPNGIELTETIRNLESKPRERAVAFHPYFANADGSMRLVEGTDNSPFATAPGINQSKISDGIPRISYLYAGLYVDIGFDPAPVKIVDWRDDDGYRCLEPVWGEVGRGIIFEPEESRTFTMRITAHREQS